MVHHSSLVVLVMHNSVVVHETLDVHHTVLRLLNELLLPWHTLVGPICHLGLQAGVLVLQLIVGLGLVVWCEAYISVYKKRKRKDKSLYYSLY